MNNRLPKGPKRRSLCTLYIVHCTLLMLLTACHDIPGYDNTRRDNFECLWRLVDEHYCFFDSVSEDWQAIGDRYRPQADTARTTRVLFDVMARMLDELHDGHVNLSSSFDVSYYRRWWSDYPQDFSLRTVQQYYLDMDWHTVCGMIYKILPSGVGYIYYPSFSYALGDGNIASLLAYFKDCPALIIDVRDNGGGDLSNVHTLVGHFIDHKIIGTYTRYKTGPGHHDFSAPYAVEYKPSPYGAWTKPVAVLTNRSCFSAANDFVAVMKTLPQVTVIGARTGGGGGMPFTYDLPAGWTVRMSVAPTFDAQMRSIESGIDPTPGCTITAPDSELAAGRDPILDFAIARLSNP